MKSHLSGSGAPSDANEVILWSLSIGHIAGRCQSGCKPLCFCSSAGIQILGIEAAQVRLCSMAELRMRSDVPGE